MFQVLWFISCFGLIAANVQSCDKLIKCEKEMKQGHFSHAKTLLDLISDDSVLNPACIDLPKLSKCVTNNKDLCTDWKAKEPALSTLSTVTYMCSTVGRALIKELLPHKCVTTAMGKTDMNLIITYCNAKWENEYSKLDMCKAIDAHQKCVTDLVNLLCAEKVAKFVEETYKTSNIGLRIINGCLQ